MENKLKKLSKLKRKLREERYIYITSIGFKISEDALRFSSGGIESGSSFGDERQRRRIHYRAHLLTGAQVKKLSLVNETALKVRRRRN